MFSMCHLCVTNFLFVILTVGTFTKWQDSPRDWKALAQAVLPTGFYPSAQDHVQVTSEHSQEQELSPYRTVSVDNLRLSLVSLTEEALVQVEGGPLVIASWTYTGHHWKESALP